MPCYRYVKVTMGGRAGRLAYLPHRPSGVFEGSMDQAKANDTQDPAEVDRIIAEELETLLDSPMFTRSPVLSRLLQFLVEHRLRARQG